MSTLANKYPNARRLDISYSLESEEALLEALSPYFQWELGEIDAGGTDIVIFRKSDPGTTSISEIMLLEDREAVTWLRFRKTAAAM
ncbi:MAG TPA: hypothetical protein PKD09_03570 [Aggregatilinea sp.]|uniref:hypothetical protein n=1 Tax=Aggregatilinea sp. TaxID=2806333 RepID=UPI002CC6D73B|nr:hypothetical protein [Aggregatilinea sp.]HML20702.1 hypothetical protein [Aggregatilinea sp.]